MGEGQGVWSRVHRRGSLHDKSHGMLAPMPTASKSVRLPTPGLSELQDALRHDLRGALLLLWRSPNNRCAPEAPSRIRFRRVYRRYRMVVIRPVPFA